jgi:hypothetical protein
MLDWRGAMLIAVALGLAGWGAPAPGAETRMAADVAGHWQGMSSGTERGPCGAVTFDLRVEGGRVGGSARSRTDEDEAADWSIFGLVDSAGRVTLETSRLDQGPGRRFEHVVWTGRVEGGYMRLSQSAGPTCSTKRTLELTRP